MNDEPDPTDTPKKADTGGMGRLYAIGGINLKPYSFAHRVAFYRIRKGDISQVESDAIFLFVLTKEAKTLDLVRGEERESAFRLEACEWAEKQRLGDILSVAAEIYADLDRALAVEPDTKDAPGNA